MSRFDANPQPRRIKFYGWTPDLPDHRDQQYEFRAEKAALPTSVDLRAACPRVYNQRQLGSCTANAIAGAIQFDRMRQGFKPNWIPSRLFVYYCERVIEHTEQRDAGASLRDGCRSVLKRGAPPERLWPYDIAQFTVRPPTRAYRVASLHQISAYQRVKRDPDQFKGCLASGYPFIFGFTVYQSFESEEVASTGIVPMPNGNENALGGHAVMAVGYDETEMRFIVRNSWGHNWGINGYFTMPYDYLLDDSLSAGFWTLRTDT